MPELGSLGSVRGALSNARPYREQCNKKKPARRMSATRSELSVPQTRKLRYC